MNKKTDSGFWPFLSYAMGLLVIAAIFMMAFFFARVEIQDLDLWLHLGSGKYILEHHYIPLNDIFSNSVGGTFWNNHEWLFQVFIYKIYDFWGVGGLTIMQISVVLLTLSVLFFLGYFRERQLFSCFLLLMVCLVFQQRFTFRPDLFSLLFFAVYMHIFAHYLTKKWAPYFLLCIQILWVNMHGFFIFGPIFVLLALLAEWIKRHVRLPYEWNEAQKLDRRECRQLIKILLLVVLGCVINPHFIKGALYPFSVLVSISGDQSIFFKHIQELQKPILAETLLMTEVFGHYKLLIILSIMSFVYNRRNINIYVLFLWIIFLFFSLKANRNMPYFAFVTYFIIISNFLSISFANIIPLRFTDDKYRHITDFFFKFCMFVWILNFTLNSQAREYFDFKDQVYKSEFGGVSLRDYPNEAIDFLIENNIQGNFYNDFNAGAYLIGRTFPNIKVFMDGRTELYGAKFFQEKYLKSWLDGKREVLDQIIAQYQLTGAILSSNQYPVPKKVLHYFYTHPDWKLVYFDYDALIFLKDVQQNKKWIKQFAIDFKKWQTPVIDLLDLKTFKVMPYEHINRAYSLESMKQFTLAEQEAQKALEINPNSADAYKILGNISAKREEFRKAHAFYRKSILLYPSDKDVYYSLGLTLMDLKEYQEAIHFYRDMVSQWPGNAKIYFFLAKAYAYHGNSYSALATLDKGLKINPQKMKSMEDIGDILYTQKKYMDALIVYERSMALYKETHTLEFKLAKTHKALGDYNLAKRYVAKSLQADPENSAYQKFLKSFN